MLQMGYPTDSYVLENVSSQQYVMSHSRSLSRYIESNGMLA